MSRATDRYREWDAAYVLGALSPEDRREFEAHLAECDECTRAVSELAGMPGLLGAVDLDSVDLDSIGPNAGARTGHDSVQAAPDLLPRLLAAARRERRRTRTAMAGALVAVAGAAAALALVLPVALGGGVAPGGPVVGGPSAPRDPGALSEAPTDLSVDEWVEMSPVVPSPLSAEFILAAESWGSRIESRCRYAASDMRRPVYNVGEQGYALYVTDTSGEPTAVATWSAAPGASVEAVGTTGLRLHEIVRVDIRSLATGQVLLVSTIGG